MGNYLGQLCPDDTFDCLVTPLDAIKALNAGGQVVSAQGTSVLACTDAGIAAAVAAAQTADRVVLLLGINDTVEAESNDRTSIDLPQCQHRLTSAIAEVGKPTVAVLINGGMVAVAQEKNIIPAIIEGGWAACCVEEGEEESGVAAAAAAAAAAVVVVVAAV